MQVTEVKKHHARAHEFNGKKTNYQSILEELVDDTNEIVSVVCDVTSDESCLSLSNVVEFLGLVVICF